MLFLSTAELAQGRGCGREAANWCTLLSASWSFLVTAAPLGSRDNALVSLEGMKRRVCDVFARELAFKFAGLGNTSGRKILKYSKL